ncbi:hypothetical protein BSL82_03590 [Tardibacter chloracetimidivorans]|uniref:Uncharacterized protein n=1 Tax=Tardibacter chloracetimidivorans TaxID=1921510 RepID=A0A1L3ZSB3_9SPHN|nr:hypothetical protein [Tardibacter chloracetimidivorans]API58500.1 hypothetical protein BSL82_03590 [Tardibacter chloracetimidivorans]
MDDKDIRSGINFRSTVSYEGEDMAGYPKAPEMGDVHFQFEHCGYIIKVGLPRGSLVMAAMPKFDCPICGDRLMTSEAQARKEGLIE